MHKAILTMYMKPVIEHELDCHRRCDVRHMFGRQILCSHGASHIEEKKHEMAGKA